MRWKIVSLIMLFFAGAAFAAYDLTADGSGKLYKYWIEPTSAASGESADQIPSPEGWTLKYAESIDQGMTFGSDKLIFLFTREVDSYDLAFGDRSSIDLIYSASGEIYSSRLDPSGGHPPLIRFPGKKGKRPVLAVTTGLKYAAWEGTLDSNNGPVKDVIFLSRWDGAWNKPLYSQITGESLSSPSLVIDPFDRYHLTFVSQERNTGLQKLYYSHDISAEPIVIFQSYDRITNPRIGLSPRGLFIYWQKVYLDRQESYIIASQDYGKHFGNPTALKENNAAKIFALNNKWLEVKNDPDLKLEEILFAPFPAPRLLSPAARSATKLASPEIIYQFDQPAIINTRIEISWDNNFAPDNTWSIDYLNPLPSTEVSYHLPVELADGAYFIRLSAFNGFSSSPSSAPIQFKINRSIPVITLLFPSGEAVDEGNIMVAGRVSEEARLTLNDFLITPEAGGDFSFPVKLLPGKNLLTLIATDEAGNVFSINKVISYASIRPEITIIKPKDSDWFRPGSTAYIEAAVRDLQNDIADESIGSLTVSGLSLSDELVYDKASGILSGFVFLPRELPDGNLVAEIKMSDSSGHTGKTNFKINVDRSPPQFTQLPSEPIYSNLSSRFALPLTDAGAGLDISGTLVGIEGISNECAVTFEAQIAVVKTKHPLSDGTYQVEILPRDRVGNSGNGAVYKLVIDTMPPALALLSSAEGDTDRPTITIKGDARDDLLSEIKITNNQHLIKSLSLQSGQFTSDIPLFPGKNEIMVEALDKAGNRTRQNITTVANINAQSLITSLANGPNPFSPRSDGQMLITYGLSAASDLRIYIFDLTGTLIWRKELLNSSGGSVAWNGTNLFGVPVESGVYPYLFQAAFNGVNEIKRGKIIVLQP